MAIKRNGEWLLFILFLLAAWSCCATAEVECFSIQDIRTQVENRLGESDLTDKIEVNTARGTFPVSVETPDVEHVPVVRVSYPGYEQAPSPYEGAAVDMQDDVDVLVGWNVHANREALTGEYIRNTTRVGAYGLETVADGSPMTMLGAITFANQMLDRYGEYGWKYQLHRCYSQSRRYKAKSGRAGLIAELDKPVDDTGFYTLEYDQLIHGIPYCGAALFLYPSRYDRKASTFEGSCRFDVNSADTYSYTLYAAVETAILSNDIPLCSFEKVQKSLETSCKEKPDTPASLRFVYIAWVDPEDREGDLVLLPAWVLESDNGPEFGISRLAVVDAQTGELLDEHRKDRHRYDAVWFGWNE